MAVEKSSVEQLIGIFTGVLPPAYVEPLEIEDNGAGMDLPHAFAAMFGLADCASNRGTQAYFLRANSAQTDSPGAAAAPAIVTLTMERAEGFSGEIRVPAPVFIEAFRTNSYGEEEVVGRYLTETDYVLPDGSGETLTIQARAENPGYFTNLYGGQCSFRFVPQGTFEVPFNVESSTTLGSLAASGDDTWNDGCVDRYIQIVPNTGVQFIAPLSILQRCETVAGWIAGILPGVNYYDAGKKGVARFVELSEVLTLTQFGSATGGNGGLLDDRGADYNEPRANGENDDAYRIHLESISDTTGPDAIARATDAILSPAGIAWRLMETGDPLTLGGRVWDLHPWDFGRLGAEFSGAEVYAVQGAVWLSTAHSRRFFVIAVAPSIEFEPALASRLWNKINRIRALGVAFRIVIDPSL